MPDDRYTRPTRGNVAPERLTTFRKGEVVCSEMLALYAFPRDHWSKLRSTNPLERVNREIGRRSDVIGIFPNDAALIRLAGALLLEQNDEWLVGRRYLSHESLSALAQNQPGHTYG